MRAAPLLLVMALSGCSAPGPAPVSDREPASVKAKPETPPPRPPVRQIDASTNGLHTVQQGDTLYAIAFANNLDYRDLAIWNNLTSPYLIRQGQVLRLKPPVAPVIASKKVEVQPLGTEQPLVAKPLADPPLLREPQAVLLPYSDANWAQVSGMQALPAPPPVASAKVEPVQPLPAPVSAKPEPEPTPAQLPAQPVPQTGMTEVWRWPAKGELTGRFGEGGGKGIDIAGERNTPVLAVAPGRVVYSGSGLRGYGRLLIVKHSGEFLSAYAHNQEMLVKEGDAVSAGQKIALMGDSDADRVKLHFEIRQYGRPLDPLKYLPNQQ
jgi:lipoprotein NlpD